jgi:uncharacterized membrane protein YhaH (DUF805 family)
MEVKKCPFCGKTVLAISKVCKHCGKSFEQPNESVKEKSVTEKTVAQVTVPPVVVTAPETAYQQIPKNTSMFQAPFSFRGRIRRLEYGITSIIYFVWYFIAMTMLESEDVLAVIALLSYIPALWFFLAQGAKRCHDRNNSGWYQIIPFYGFWMLFAEGDNTENGYGVPPK